MSDDKNQETRDAILEKNVGQLLRHSHEPPTMNSAARERVFEELSAKLSESASEQAKKEEKKEATSGFFSMLFATPLRASLVAATAAAVVVAATVIVNQDTDRGLASAFDPQRIENEGPAPMRVELEDGSIAILRAGAAMRTLSPRHVSIETGTVLFDVAKGDSEFTVTSTTEGRRVVVLGTRFVASTDGNKLLAAVIRGRVSLESTGGALALGAGEGGEATGDGVPRRVAIPRLSHLVSWAKGARARSEGMDAAPIRTGNLIAKNAGFDGVDYPLPVRKLGIDIHLENQVARVAIDQTFFNEEPRQLEGVYSFALPAGAAISRLAMYVAGKRMEAGIAERTHARNVYESIVYRRRDPALMEWMAGNEVKVRIFPLFGRQEKRILLSYTQSLDKLYDDIQLTVPLARLEAPVGVFDLNATLVGCANCEVVSTSHAISTQAAGDDLNVRFNAKQFAVQDDLLLTIRLPKANESVVVHPDGDDNLILARVTPELGNALTSRSKPRRWVILHDTSGSRTPLESLAQTHVATRLLEELDESDEVAVVAFDATVRTFDDGAFVSVSNADRKAIHDFVADQSTGVGYTDLSLGLDSAASLLEKAPDAASYEPMIIYVGDGIATGGGRKPSDLVRAVGGRATVIAVAIGAKHDDTAMSALAAATGGASAVLNPGQDLDWRVFDLVASLHGERITNLTASIPGTDVPVYLSTEQLADGEELSLTSRISGAVPGSIEIRGVRAGKPWTHTVKLSGVPSKQAGYLSRLWARERIAALVAEEGTTDADHKQAITDLALKHWLLTPYTSLLVLETEADYGRYKVARSKNDGWAAYRVPDKIEVVSEPFRYGVDLDAVPRSALIFRAPSPVFVEANQQSFGDGLFMGDLDGEAMAGFGSGRAMVDTGWGTIGSGNFGTIGHGGGGMSANESGLSAWVGAEGKANPAQSRSGPLRADEKAFGTSVLSNDVIVGTSSSLGYRGRRRSARRQPGEQLNWRTTSRGGKWETPTALTYSGDPRWNDLSSFVPALFSSALDRERERITRATAGKKKFAVAIGARVHPAARKMIEKARELAGRRRYRGASGEVIDVDSKGRFSARRRTSLGLVEELRYDGNSLKTDYPELDLSVTRNVGPAEPLLLEEQVPMLLARAGTLANFYLVTTESDAAVALTPPGGGWKLVVHFDEKGRFIRLDRVQGALVKTRVEVRYAGSEVTVIAGGGARKFDTEAVSDSAVELTTPARSVDVAMPLRHPELVRDQLRTAPSRKLEHQLAASLAALGDASALGSLVAEMATKGQLSDGELVLLSAGIATLDAAKSQKLARGDSALAAYVRSASAFSRTATAAVLTEAANAKSWSGSLALVRRALTRGKGIDSQVADAKALLARDNVDALGYLVASGLWRYYGHYKPKLITPLWRQVIAKGEPWASRGQVELARALGRTGKYKEAVALWIELRNTALASGRMPPIDYQTKRAFQASPSGSAGWSAFWASTRKQALASQDVALVLDLFVIAHQLGRQSDLPSIASAAESIGLSVARRVRVVVALSNAGLRDDAIRMFAPLSAAAAAGDVEVSEVLRLASTFASSRGDLEQAARFLHRVMELDEPQSLAQVRSDHRALLMLYNRIAQSVPTAERDDAIASIERVASDWRELDPDYPNLDIEVATQLQVLGREVESFRVLSTIIERHPMEGKSFELVANVLEGQGRLERALELWQRAVSVEPENPTWLMRSAQALVAAGRPAEARAVYQKVVSNQKEWQERFAWIVPQAKAALRQL